MSVFDMDGMKPALDGMVPAGAKVRIENEINDAQGAEYRTL
jgi:hypothetical protein